jgi:hypothetical protein
MEVEHQAQILERTSVRAQQCGHKGHVCNAQAAQQSVQKSKGPQESGVRSEGLQGHLSPPSCVCSARSACSRYQGKRHCGESVCGRHPRAGKKGAHACVMRGRATQHRFCGRCHLQNLWKPDRQIMLLSSSCTCLPEAHWGETSDDVGLRVVSYKATSITWRNQQIACNN